MTHGDKFSAQGQWVEAMKAYRYALGEFPNNAAAVIGFGKAGLSSGNVEIARKAFQQALKINPANLEALANMADIHERTGQLDAAAETFLRIGNVYSSQGNLDEAIDSWTRATKLISGHVDAYRKMAEALIEQGKIRQAARQYLTLAAIYQRRHDQAQVRAFLDLAEELLPNDPGIVAAREAADRGDTIQPGSISDVAPAAATLDFDEDFGPEHDPFGLDDLFSDGEAAPEQRPTGGLIESARARALEALANVVFEDNDNPYAIVIMQAVDLQSRHDLLGAIGLYRQAVDSGSSSAALAYNLGLLYREQGQFDNAATMLQRALPDQTYAQSAQFALGETYFVANKFEASLRHFVEAVAAIDLQTVSGHRSYELAQSYQTLADNYLAQGDNRKITRFISTLQDFFAHPNWEQKLYDARQRMNGLSNDEHTMSLAEFLETPDTPILIEALSFIDEYMKQGFLMTASEICLRAIQQVPGYLPLHARLADILLRLDHTDNAINKYLYVSRVFQMRGQPDQAVAIYEKVLKLAPMDVTVRSKLIEIYLDQKELIPALDQYLVLADSYYQLAQVDRAIEKYNEALREASASPETKAWQKTALSRIADIYNQRFDWTNAAGAYNKLLDVDPTDEHAMLQLVQLYFRQTKKNEATKALDRLLHYYQRTDPRKALDILKDLVATYPDDLALRQRLAVAYVQNNRTKDAIAEYDTLGEMQLEHGLRDQAIQTIQAIINLGPDDVAGYQRLLSKIGG